MKCKRKIPGVCEIAGDMDRTYWNFVDSMYYLSTHCSNPKTAWDKIYEKFGNEMNYLDERLNQCWNEKVIKEWETGVKEYLIECNFWKE